MYRNGIQSMFVGFCLLIVTSLLGAPDNATSGNRADRPELDVGRFGAVGDGTTDDTAAIQSAVDASIGRIRFPRGRYRITKTITVDLDRVGPTSIDGGGTATILMDGPGPAFRFVGTHEGTASPDTVTDNVWKNQRAPMVDAIEIVGGHEKADGIEAAGTMQMILSRVVIRRARHGVHLVQRNRNVIVSQCHIYENRGAGIFYDQVDLHQSIICNSHISYNAGGGVVIRGGSVRNVHIGTCDIEGNMGGPDSVPTANVLLDSTGGSIGEVAIVGCTIQHAHEAPGSANIRVDGTSTALGFTGELRHGNITIADNVLSDVQVNIDLRNTRGVTISGNTIWKGYERNLRVVGCDNVVVQGNVCDRNPRYHYGDGADAKLGLEFVDSNDCTLASNHIYGTGALPAAVMLRRCRRFNITGCTILDAGECGLTLDDVSESRVSDCLIRDDRDGNENRYSVRVTRGRNNMIINNLLGNRSSIDSASSHIQGNVVVSSKGVDG